MPEIACSTTILELESTRFRMTSPIESFPLRGFFWLVRDHAFGFIALEPTIFLKCRVLRKFIVFFITDRLIMPTPFRGVAQICDCLVLFMHNDNIIIGVRFLFAAVIVFLFAWMRWSLAFTFSPINHKIVERACFQYFL